MQRKTSDKLIQLSRQFCLLCLLLAPITIVVAESFDTGVFEFQKKMADSGNAQAQFKLGSMYESGRGVGLDMFAAMHWYEKSAANNYKPAKNRIVFLQIKKSGFKPEHKNWLDELRNDAEAGDGEAMMILGEMHESGTGVSKNLVAAQGEYKRATVKGIAGSEGAHYAVTDVLNKQKQQAQLDEEKRVAAEKLRKEEADREALRKKAQQEQEQQRQAQAKKDSERKSLEEERRALEEQKRQLDMKEKELAEQKKKSNAPEPVAKPVAEAADGDVGFKSDTCASKAARFRSQCQ